MLTEAMCVSKSTGRLHNWWRGQYGHNVAQQSSYTAESYECGNYNERCNGMLVVIITSVNNIIRVAVRRRMLGHAEPAGEAAGATFGHILIETPA